MSIITVFLKLFLLKLFAVVKTLLPIPGGIGFAATFPPPFAAPGRTPLQYLSTSLTSAQLLALFSGAPVNLVPAPGVGFRIVPIMILMRFFGGSVAYLDGGGGAVTFSLGTASLALASNALFLVTVAPNRRTGTVMWSNGLTAILDTAANPPTDDNAPLTISKATADFTAGNGTARVSVYYAIEPTT